MKAIKKRKILWESLKAQETGGNQVPTGRKPDGTFGEGQKGFAASTALLREFERQRPGRHSRRLARQLLDRTRPRAVTLRTSYGIFYVSPTPDGYEYRSFELPGYRVDAIRAGDLDMRIHARRLF